MIFLGGTCNNSTWRDELIPLLEVNKIPYYNPIVDDWTEECRKKEDEIKANRWNIELYVITKEMKGVFSIAEVVDCVHRKCSYTIFMVIEDGFDKAQLRSLNAVKDLIKYRGGWIVNSFEEIVDVYEKYRYMEPCS